MHIHHYISPKKDDARINALSWFIVSMVALACIMIILI